MSDVSPRHPAVLATDLDGTLIPLRNQSPQARDLHRLREGLAAAQAKLAFVTGRHYRSVLRAIEEFALPEPDWILCDVGTTIYRREASHHFSEVTSYQEHLAGIVTQMPLAELREHLSSISGLELQAEDNQGPFKLSYCVEAALLDAATRQIQQFLETSAAPYSVVDSVDPYSGIGLIDLLPRDVSKAHALQWWIAETGIPADSLVFAGDSGNDLQALTAGYRSIVVGNAEPALRRRVYEHHRGSGKGQLFLAKQEATSGVLEGCHWYGILEQSSPRSERLGATPMGAGATHFRVWAPKRRIVEVEQSTAEGAVRHRLDADGDGYFCGTISGMVAGDTYRYLVDDEGAFPDPASRYQPEGVHGPSQIVDPRQFAWTDQAWSGVPKRDLVIYELHIGTFTSAGTYRAAIDRLPQLVELGVTAIEVMPVAQTPGRWNWGYDGVNLFAPRNSYGEPDDFRAFVDACHRLGLAVLLDVVYNHLGPEGNYLAQFGHYFSKRHGTPWGEAFNFDAAHSDPVRRFIVENALHWVEEYHLDGLRLDAVQFMIDESEFTILDELSRAISEFRDSVQRPVHLIAESNVYDEALLTPRPSRPAYDAIWCDCLMHSIYTHAEPELQLSHRKYKGGRDLSESLLMGFIYTAPNRVRLSEQDREVRLAGRPTHLTSLVAGLQTHDAVGNHPRGLRIHQVVSKAYQRAAAAIILLYPTIPILFMGEEQAAETPFPFFVDFEDPQLREAVDEGRAREYPQHVWGDVAPPSAAETFQGANLETAGEDPGMVTWYRQLLALRRDGIAEGWLSPQTLSVHCAVEHDLFRLQYETPAGGGVSVAARLTNSKGVPSPNRTQFELPVRGQVVLGSDAELPGVGQGVETLKLGANQAIIYRWD